MIHMLSRFNLADGASAEQVARGYVRLVTLLRQHDLVAATSRMGQRLDDTPMDTDAGDNRRYFTVMSFRDRAQLDRSYAQLLGDRPGPALAAAHDFIRNSTRDQLFTCWQDPD